MSSVVLLTPGREVPVKVLAMTQANPDKMRFINDQRTTAYRSAMYQSKDHNYDGETERIRTGALVRQAFPGIQRLKILQTDIFAIS